MGFRIVSEHLNGLKAIAPDVFNDARGFFTEVYRSDHFEALGLPTSFCQDNHSRSVRGVLRGLHFQWQPPMGKLMRVSHGRAFLVAVDIRKSSPTLGQWFGIEASHENCVEVWAPAGFARGFCVLSEFADIQYKCTGIYNPECESAIRWNDPVINIAWPIENPILSTKDENAGTLADWLDHPKSDCLN